MSASEKNLDMGFRYFGPNFSRHKMDVFAVHTVKNLERKSSPETTEKKTIWFTLSWIYKLHLHAQLAQRLMSVWDKI